MKKVIIILVVFFVCFSHKTFAQDISKANSGISCKVIEKSLAFLKFSMKSEDIEKILAGTGLESFDRKEVEISVKYEQVEKEKSIFEISIVSDIKTEKKYYAIFATANTQGTLTSASFGYSINGFSADKYYLGEPKEYYHKASQTSCSNQDISILKRIVLLSINFYKDINTSQQSAAIKEEKGTSSNTKQMKLQTNIRYYS